MVGIMLAICLLFVIPNDIQTGNAEDSEPDSRTELLERDKIEDSEQQSHERLTWSMVIRVGSILYRYICKN